MKSKTSFFNRSLFFSLLKRYWPIFAAYIIIWLIMLPLALANQLSYNSTYMVDMQNIVAVTAHYILNTGLVGGVIMSGIFGAVIAMAAFNYLYNARSVSMMCSLPIRREGVFLSLFTSGLVGMFVLNIITFLTTIAVCAAYGILAPCTAYLFQWLAMVCMTNLFFFGFAALCSSFTGNIIVLPLVYAVLNFTVYVVEMLVRLLGSMFIYGLSMNDSASLGSLSPPVYLLTSTNVNYILEPSTTGTMRTIGYYYDGWAALCIYAVVGIIFASLAMLLIKNRRMETASDVVALKPLKPIFKYCLSVGCSLVLGILIYQMIFINSINTSGLKSMLIMLLLMLFGAFIGYFAAEMLIKKTFRVFSGRSWIGMGVTAFVIIAFMFAGEYDLFRIERNLPEANEIQDVSIRCQGETVLFEQPENIEKAIELQKSIIENKDANEAASYQTDSLTNSSYYVDFIYTYKNQDTLSREYSIYYPVTDDILTLNELMNSTEAVQYRKNLNIPVTLNSITDANISYFDKESGSYRSYALTDEHAYELYSECIVPDMDDGSLGKIWLRTNDSYYENVYDCTFSFSVTKRDNYGGYSSDYFYTTLTVNSTRSNKWVQDKFGISFCTMGESSEILAAQSDEESRAYAEKYGVTPPGA